MAGSHSARTGTLPLRRRPAGAKTLALARGSRDDGQRQAHSREPRHRYSPCGSAFLSSCGMGSTAGAGISGLHRLRRRGPDYSLEFTSLTALAFAQICQEVGLPAGVVNIITGDGSTGEALVKHPGVDKIAFTGSTEVGRAIRKATAQSHKKLSLELGGKSPFIIFEDADLDSAVEGLVDGIWLNQGQVCCAGSRLLMQESVAETLIGKVRERMSTLRVGAPLDKAIDIGAIVARVQLERIQRLVEQGVAEGATSWQPPSLVMPSRGLFFPP